MTHDDPLLQLIAERNPVPDPDALSDEQRSTADALRRQIRAETVRHTRRGNRGRPLRTGLVVLAGVLPALVILVIALSTHSRPRAVHALRRPSHAIGGIVVPPPGAPQTLLLIGSDHRAGESYHAANTDTILLIRLNADSKTVNVLSIPRDLIVRIPQGGTSFVGKINAAYSVGGPNELLGILQSEVFPNQGFHINHVIDMNFAGFSDIVDQIGCVYSDVDHRYFNRSAPGQDNYSSIDIQPGYQPLCGDHQSATGALAFVRFRHTDSDLVREARLQDFVGWARQNFTGGQLFTDRNKLVQIMAEHSQSDASLHSADAIENLILLLANSAGDSLKAIPFPAEFVPCTTNAGLCGVSAAARREAEAYQAFMTPTGAAAPAPAGGSSAGSSSTGGSSASGQTTTAGASPGANGGLVDAAGDGGAQAAALSGAGLPVAYPAQIAAGSSYCSDATGNCDGGAEPRSAYTGSYPRAYRIAGPGGTAYPSYRMTLVLNAELGEYYGVQGTTWQDPPILRNPTRTEQVGGRQLVEYYDGDRLSLVAWHTSSAVYWVSNTLTGSIPPSRLIAIAASLRVAP